MLDRVGGCWVEDWEKLPLGARPGDSNWASLEMIWGVFGQPSVDVVWIRVVDRVVRSTKVTVKSGVGVDLVVVEI